MLAEGLIIGVILSVILGGDVRKLRDIHINYYILLLLAFFLRFIGYQVGILDFAYNIIIGRAINIISLLMLLLVKFKNFQLAGMKILFVGTLANFLVMVLNNGAMPVHEGLAIKLGLDHLIGSEFITHISITEGTRLAILADIIPIPYPIIGGRLLSIGDVLLTLGLIQLIYCNSRAKRLSFLGQSAKIE